MSTPTPRPSVPKQDPNAPTHTDRQGPGDPGPVSPDGPISGNNPAQRQAPGQGGDEVELPTHRPGTDDPGNGRAQLRSPGTGNQSHLGSAPTRQHDEMGHGR